ncbi:MAG: pyridoxal-dependent decarboxylase, partial [Acidobacteriota bacterium]
DTFVFNPHKWMFTNFDCSAYFIKDKDALIRTFSILPEYLKTSEGDTVNNYRDWGIALGRRFRALKLWFVMRSYGAKGLKKKVSDHVKWAAELKENIVDHSDFELMAPVPFATICFRYHPKNVNDEDLINSINNSLMDRLNKSGNIYLTHTKLKGKFTLRLVIGQTEQTREHVIKAWELIKNTAAEIFSEN